jgi:formiminoglutamase
MALFHDPNWPRAGAWLRGELQSHVEAVGELAIIGAPLARGSITPGRCDLAPMAIRKALDRFSTYDVLGRRDLLDIAARDLGDLDIAALTPQEAFAPITNAVTDALARADAVVLLGGDNAITYPGCSALINSAGGTCGLITFDAHLDLRDLDRGLTNGNPVRALLRDGLPGSNVIQIGIQSFANSGAYARVAAEAGVNVIPSEKIHSEGIDAVVSHALETLRADVIYVDVDLDVLDRSFSPATPGSRPGGLAPWQLRRAIRRCGSDSRVRVMDLVEIDPEKDIADQTVLSAAACLFEFVSGLHERCSSSKAVRN